MRPVRADSTIAAIGLAAIAALCCVLPLVAAALTSAGVGAWLLTPGSLLAAPLFTVAAGLLLWRSRRYRQ